MFLKVLCMTSRHYYRVRAFRRFDADETTASLSLLCRDAPSSRRSIMSSDLYIALAVLVILAAAIAIYNSLVSGQQLVRNAWSQIDVQLKRRHDLIPNLANVVKGALSAEKEQLAAVMAARGNAQSARTPQDAMQAETALTGALRQLFAVVESYPQLRSQENVAGLMEELSTTENKIAFARQYYNDVVQSQNERVASFPGVVLARLFGFASETMFQVAQAEHAQIEAVPEVRI
jgi:LemA protein